MSPARVALSLLATRGDGRARAAAALPRLLSAQAPTMPSEWRFTRSALGRPSIAAPAGSGLEFSLSHTDGLVAVAVACGCSVGVDVERVRPLPEAPEAFFTPFERRIIAASPAALLQIWTIKEAYAKARGLGLSLPFRDVEVDPAPPVVRLRDGEAGLWRFHPFAWGDAHLGALVVRGDAVLRWPPRARPRAWCRGSALGA